jgi:hypothetical protein
MEAFSAMSTTLTAGDPLGSSERVSAHRDAVPKPFVESHFQFQLWIAVSIQAENAMIAVFTLSIIR